MNAESPSTTPPPGGLEQAHVIDQIAHDAQTDEVRLTMVERRPWDGSELQLFQLQEKLNTYLSFALDGELAEAYPALRDKRVRLRLECATPPDETVIQFLRVVREQVAFQGIEVEVLVAGGSCGPGCACAS